MYEELYLRNEGYVSGELQSRIRATRVLIAGCGIGSTIAEAALRLGFEYLTLADGDTVELHNLNRQAYEGADAGKLKAEALAARLLRINPEARITTHADWITEDNVSKLVAGADLVFDTIDFLDLKTICDLHDEAYRQKTPIISAVSAGWGLPPFIFPRPGPGPACFVNSSDCRLPVRWKTPPTWNTSRILSTVSAPTLIPKWPTPWPRP